MLIELAAACEARRLVLDSSGSAALAAASAAARGGLPLRVHTPANLAGPKRDALAALGAETVAEGTRSDASDRALAEASQAFLASHVFHPAFILGTARSGREVLAAGTRAGEVWIVPVGNGSLLLGLALSLDQAADASTVTLVAVQSGAAPGLTRPGWGAQSCAAGINIADPPRREAILAALDRHHGFILTVSDTEILEGQRRLGALGLAAERAAAAAEAGLGRLRAQGEQGNITAWLTGSGLREVLFSPGNAVS